jgi:hypothetical protein
MGLSSRTISLLAKPFEGGSGPSHAVIDLIWATAGAEECLPTEGNKLQRVLGGLKALQARAGDPFDGAATSQLEHVASELATRLMMEDENNADQLDAALAKDGFAAYVGDTDARGGPVDRLAAFLRQLFGERSTLHVSRNHYEQATRAFERDDWEAANAQFRSACDAAFDVLAHAKGCPKNKKGGAARQWLEAQGLLAKDEADLTRAFMAFAGRAGSHAGISDQVDAQLRRHFATALLSFAIAKIDT